MKKIKWLMSMRQLAFFFLFIFGQSYSVLSQQQDENAFYLFKKDWAATKNLDKAAYFMQVTRESDTAYVCRYYNLNGPMIRQESYFNSELTIPNGRFCWYDAKGYLDSTGLVHQRHKDGVWSYFNDSLYENMSILYDKGHFVERIDVKQQEQANAVSSDSIQRSSGMTADELNAYQRWRHAIGKSIAVPERFLTVLPRANYEVVCSFCSNREDDAKDIFLMKSCEWSVDAEVMKAIREKAMLAFTGNKGKKNCRIIQSVVFEAFYSSEDSAIVQTSVAGAEKIFIKLNEVPAMFPGGEIGWKQYIEKNIDDEVPVRNNAPIDNYTVVISFLVDEQGNISEVMPLNDPGWGTAEEAVRVIKKGPAWVPAVQNGKNVIYRQKQSMTFFVSETLTTGP